MPVTTRQRSNITYESDGTSESDNDSSYSSSSHPTTVKPKKRDDRGRNAGNDTGKTPEQRAQEVHLSLIMPWQGAMSNRTLSS